MKSRAVFALTFAAMAAASGAWAVNEADYVYSYPLNSNAALNGDMFTNSTEILTPRGIIDEPSTPMLLRQEPAAGPEDTQTDDPLLPISPAETPPTTEASPTT